MCVQYEHGICLFSAIFPRFLLTNGTPMLWKNRNQLQASLLFVAVGCALGICQKHLRLREKHQESSKPHNLKKMGQFSINWAQLGKHKNGQFSQIQNDAVSK